MEKGIWILTAIALAAWCVGCGSDNDESDMLAEFKVVSESTGVTGYGTGYVKFTIENVGDGPAQSVSCRVHAKDGDRIMDSGIAYFAMGGSIMPGEKAENEVVFLKLTSLAGLTLDYEFEWIEN